MGLTSASGSFKPIFADRLSSIFVALFWLARRHLQCALDRGGYDVTEHKLRLKWFGRLHGTCGTRPAWRRWLQRPSCGRRAADRRPVREEEYRLYLGGLRNPSQTVSKSLSLRRLGHRVREVFECLGSTLWALGSRDCVGLSQDLILLVRRLLRQELGPGEKGITGFDAVLWRAALLREVEAPEEEVPTWLAEGCPMGIGSSVVGACGVFLPTGGLSKAILASKEFGQSRQAEDWKHENPATTPASTERTGSWRFSASQTKSSSRLSLRGTTASRDGLTPLRTRSLGWSKSATTAASKYG